MLTRVGVLAGVDVLVDGTGSTMCSTAMGSAGVWGSVRLAGSVP